MRLLGLDLETTGVNFEKDRVIEIGLVLWDTDLNMPLQMYSEFICEPDRPGKDTDHVLTEIPDSVLKEFGIDMEMNGDAALLFDVINKMVLEADYIVAHNGNQFDKIMLQNFFDRYGERFPALPWIDTLTDINYPPHCVSRNLMYLAAFHGFVNPFPHRALFDVMTMFQILKHYNIEEIIERSQMIDVTVQAIVSFDNKELAKAQKFQWNPEKKIWSKKMKESDVTEQWIDSLGFEISILE